MLWTRLAPEPGNPDVLGRSFVPVRWRVATDSRMRHVVARGTAVAAPQLAHSVHVEVNGLQPGRDYFYQFDARSEESRVGHFRTAPREHEMLRETRFAFVTCQSWQVTKANRVSRSISCSRGAVRKWPTRLSSLRASN